MESVDQTLWIVWTERWKLEDSIRVGSLPYIVGNNAFEMYKSCELGDGDKYGNEEKQFTEHFQRKVILLFERAQFVKHLQEEDKPVMRFLEERQYRAYVCSYCDLRDDMIHTQIEAGCAVHKSELRN